MNGYETIRIIHPKYTEKNIDIDLPFAENTTKIILNTGCCIEGYVYDNNGNPRANFPLIATSERRNYTLDNQADNSTTTDKDGYYKFLNLPEKLITLTHPSVSNTQGACRNLILPIEGKSTRLDFGGTYFLTGRIFINGSPLSNTDLFVRDTVSSWEGFLNNGRTYSDGSFTFSGISEGPKQLGYKISNSYDLNIIEFNTKESNYDLGDVYLDLVNAEFMIEGYQNTKVDSLDIFENFGKPAKTGHSLKLTNNGVAKAEKLIPGNYKIFVNLSNSARLIYYIDIPKIEGLYTTTIKIPPMTSSVYGRLPSDSPSFTFENKEHQYRVTTYYNQKDGTYRIENIPAGKYIIEDTHQEEVTTFEVLEGQTLEMNLDTYNPTLLAIADIITIDSKTRRKIEDVK